MWLAEAKSDDQERHMIGISLKTLARTSERKIWLPSSSLESRTSDICLFAERDENLKKNPPCLVFLCVAKGMLRRGNSARSAHSRLHHSNLPTSAASMFSHQPWLRFLLSFQPSKWEAVKQFLPPVSRGECWTYLCGKRLSQVLTISTWWIISLRGKCEAANVINDIHVRLLPLI